MLKKNDILTVTVIDINHEGLGVAKQDGAVIFIKGAVTGDSLSVKIIKVAKNYYVGKIEKLIVPSPHRCNDTTEDCGVFGRKIAENWGFLHQIMIICAFLRKTTV